MADSVGLFLSIDAILTESDRVFAHAVNTVKKIPRAAGSSRPPLEDRLLVPLSHPFPCQVLNVFSYMGCINKPQKEIFQESFLVQELKKMKRFVQNGT
jgi:hypothetical protein